MRRTAGGPAISGSCVILDDGSPALRGRGRYDWAPGQNGTPGAYHVEFQVTIPGQVRKTYPEKRPADLVIRREIVTV